MAISGISTTNDNGVRRITNNQNVTGTGTIDGETVVLDRGGSRLESDSNGSIVVTNSQIKLDSDVPGDNDNKAVINYGGRAKTTTTMKFVDSTILTAPLTARKNVMVTWLENATVIEGGNTGKLFCYTAKNSHLENVLFRGINVWEVYRSPLIAFNIKVSDVNYGYLNWEAGRLDFFGFKTENIGEGYFWHGTGNSGRNYSYHWNPDTSVDFEKLALTHARNRVYIGYTATWEFLDLISKNKIEDLYLSYSDNRSGTTQVKGTYVTNSDGHLVGTYDSQNDSSGSNIVRPTLFVRDKQITHVDTGNPGAYDYPLTTIKGHSKNYDIDNVNAYIELRSYAHQAASGFEVGDEFIITDEIGSINADKSVAKYSKKFMTPDAGVTVSKSTALGYTKLDNLEKLYDRTKAEWRDNNNYPLVVKDGSKVDLGATRLDIKGSSGDAYNYSSSKITINIDDTIQKTNKFNTIKTTGNVYISDDAIIDGLVFDNDVYLNQASDLTNITINGDLHINTGANSELDFDNVTVTGNITNDDSSHTLTINATNGSSVKAKGITEWKSPGTLANDTAVGTQAWDNPSNAGSSNNQYAHAESSTSSGTWSTSNYLKATNFGFSIPSGASIAGIEVRIERHKYYDAKDNEVKIIKGGTVGSENKASSSGYPSSDAFANYGGSSDLWSETWTRSNINSSNFGVVLSSSLWTEYPPDRTHSDAYIDVIQIKVYYSNAGTGNGEVNIQRPVTLKVTALDDKTGSGINNAHVIIQKESDKTTVKSGQTNSSGIYEVTHYYDTDIPIVGWVRQWDLSGEDYIVKTFSGTITNQGLEINTRLTPI